MALAAATSLNKVTDEETFSDLATIVTSRLGLVSSLAIAGEQKFNSIKDEITVDALVGHFKAAFSDSLPTTNIPAAGDLINSTIDIVTLAHVVKYLKDVAGIDISVPANSIAPVISGSGTGPFTVSNNGTWSNDPDSYTYQWQADTVDIGGATTNTLAQDAGYVGVSIRCMVAGVNEAGAGTATASNAIVGA